MDKLQVVCKINLYGKEKPQSYSYYYDKKEILQLFILKDKIVIIQRNEDIKIIYKNSFKSYSSIKKIDDYGFFSATELTSTGDIACCREDGIISIFTIKPIICILIQNIKVLDKKQVYRIKDITNNKLVSNQDEKSLIFYEYSKNRLKMTNKIMMENYIENFLPTKNNDILLYANFFCPRYHYKILLFDSEKLNIIKEVLSCNGNSSIYEPFSFLTKNIVAIIIAKTIFLVDINKDYTVITQIENKTSSWMHTICCLSHNKIITGDENGYLLFWYYDKNILNKVGEIKYSNVGLTSLMKLKKNIFLVGGEYYYIYACNFLWEKLEKKRKQ